MIYERTTADDTGGFLVLPIVANTNIMKYFELRWSYKTNASVSVSTTNMVLLNLVTSGFFITDAGNVTGGLLMGNTGNTTTKSCDLIVSSDSMALAPISTTIKVSSFISGIVKFYISSLGSEHFCRIESMTHYIDNGNARKYIDFMGNYYHTLGNYSSTAKIQIGQLTANPVQSLRAIMLGSVR